MKKTRVWKNYGSYHEDSGEKTKIEYKAKGIKCRNSRGERDLRQFYSKTVPAHVQEKREGKRGETRYKDMMNMEIWFG